MNPGEPDRCNEDWHEQANASHDTPPSELYDTSDELWWERRYSPELDREGCFIPGTVQPRDRL